MKIVFFHNDHLGLSHVDLMSNPSSGTVLAMLNLARGLSKSGHSIVVLSKAESKIIDNVEYIAIDDNEKCLEWYKHNDVDVFISVGHTHSIISKLKVYKKSLIYHWHHNYLDIKNVIAALKKKDIDGVVCVSPHHLSSLYKYGMDFGMTYIRNALDFDEMSRYKSDFEEERNGLAYVGNVSLAKGFLEAIYAYYSYLQKGGKEKIHVYGSTNLYLNKISDIDLSLFEPEFQFLINNLLNKGMIVFHGKQPREYLYEELQKRKLLLCGLNKTGAAETAGMGMIEAQYFGCKVITFNRGGQKDSVYDKNSIIKVSDDLALKILQLSSVSNQLEIPQDFFERYSVEKISKEWLSLFRGELKKKKHLEALLARIDGILCK
ncbi:TPA: glycosyltransferase [Escherichia coli]